MRTGHVSGRFEPYGVDLTAHSELVGLGPSQSDRQPVLAGSRRKPRTFQAARLRRSVSSRRRGEGYKEVVNRLRKRALLTTLVRAGFEPQPGDVVTAEHWCSSGFANTDLDMQLKKHGIHKVIVMGLIAHTCVEATVRYAAELGYEVTVVKDATASYSDQQMHASLEVNLPNYAGAIVTTDEIVAPSLPPPAWKSLPSPDLRVETRMVSRLWCEC